MRPALSLNKRSIEIKNNDGKIITISYRNDFGRVYYWVKDGENKGIEITGNGLYEIIYGIIYGESRREKFK